jgi:hypothetical protein
LVVQQLVEQTIAIVPRRLRRTAPGRKFWPSAIDNRSERKRLITSR